MADLTTLAAVKAYLAITATNDDTLLQGLVTAYSEWVRSETNRDFTSTTYDIWRSGRDERILHLPQFPITAVNGLWVDGKAIPAQAAFGSYGYRFTDAAIILDGTSFARGEANIRIQYTAGFATVPADISNAVVELIGLHYKNRDRIGYSAACAVACPRSIIAAITVSETPCVLRSTKAALDRSN